MNRVYIAKSPTPHEQPLRIYDLILTAIYDLLLHYVSPEAESLSHYMFYFHAKYIMR